MNSQKINYISSFFKKQDNGFTDQLNGQGDKKTIQQDPYAFGDKAGKSLASQVIDYFTKVMYGEEPQDGSRSRRRFL
jgi:hypothetical protein